MLDAESWRHLDAVAKPELTDDTVIELSRLLWNQ